MSPRPRLDPTEFHSFGDILLVALLDTGDDFVHTRELIDRLSRPMARQKAESALHGLHSAGMVELGPRYAHRLTSFGRKVAVEKVVEGVQY